MTKELEIIKRKLLREQVARAEAEKLLEEKSLQLFNSNQQLKILNSDLKSLVTEKSQKLLSTENEYHILVESINDLIFKTNLQGEIIYANQIAKKILKEVNVEIIGKKIFSFLPFDQADRISRFLYRRFIGKFCVSYLETKLTIRNNSERWFGVTIQFSEKRCLNCEKKYNCNIENRTKVMASSDCEYQTVIVIAHDITEQKLIQLDLEKSEKRYRELTEFLPELICEVTTKGIITYANQFALDKFGYTKEIVLNGSFDVFKIFHKKNWEQIEKNLFDVLTIGETQASEYDAVKQNGDTFPVIVYSSPIFDDDLIVGVRGVMVDITDRKNSELETAKNLRQQEILSQVSLSYNTLNGFAEKTNDVLRIIGEHVDVSRVYIFQDEIDGLSTSNTFEWCSKEIIPQIKELQNLPYLTIPSWKYLLLRDGVIKASNVEELADDIKIILESQGVQSIIVLPIWVEGNFFGFIGFDDCSRKRVWSKSEQELLRTISSLIANAFVRDKINKELTIQAQENAGIVSSIPDQILRLSGDGTIISFHSSRTESGLFEIYKKGNISHIKDLFDSELTNSFEIAIHECIALGNFKFDFSYLNWDVIQYYEARFVRLKDNSVLVIIRNVTEAKQNEELLRIAKIKAEEASRAKSEFIANVSHEIRTPMNAILGFSEWLHDNVIDELHKSYLHTVMSSGRNLLTLINDILDLSKIESGKLTLQIEPVKIQQIVSDIGQVLKQKLEAKNLAFNTTIDPSVPKYIFMDEVRMYQILFNIISNAVKFTSKGFIHVAVSGAIPCEKINEIDLLVSIEDTGIGINEDQQENIFSAFSQQSGQSNRHYEGTGLGLSIVSGLLKQLKATVKLKSSPGKGSTFSLKFNEVKVADLKEEVEVAGNLQKKPVLNSGKILIVDDVDFNIKVLKRIIDSDKVSFLEAQNGEQALDILESELPDIIFMDILMPGISGYETTELIKKQERLKHIPVVAFTASTLDSDADRINSLFDAFLQKPALRKDVYGVLKKFLSDKFDAIDMSPPVNELPEATLECISELPVILDALQNRFFDHWVKVKDDLIIFEIEEFYNELNNFSKEEECSILSQYCLELNLGIQSFDIDKIRIKLNEFPDFIEKLKSYTN